MCAAVRIRALAADDAAAVRALVAAELGDTPYGEVAASALTQALESTGLGSGTEAMGLVAERADEVAGVILYGLVAGSQGAGKLHLIIVTASARLQGVGHQLCDAAAASLAAHDARFIIAEVADDPRIAPARALLARTGFHEEGRVSDFFADGIALVFLRRDLIV